MPSFEPMIGASWSSAINEAMDNSQARTSSSKPTQANVPSTIVNAYPRASQAADVDLCVQKMLQGKEPPLSNSDIESTTKSILEASGSEFNLAKILTLAVLRSDPQTVIQRLNELPTQTVLSISIEFLNLGYLSRIIVLWLLELDGPLTLKALQASLPILAKNTAAPGYSFNETTATDVILSCEPLFTVNTSNKFVQLNPEIRKHRSFVRDFWSDTASQLYLGIVKAGLEFFTSGQSSNGLLRDKSDISRLLQDNPFLEHATMWPTYIHRLGCLDRDKLEEAKQLADKLFDLPECFLYAKQIYFYVNEESAHFNMTFDGFNTWVKSMNKLQLASRWGLTRIVERTLADSPGSVAERDTRSSTALHESAKGGFVRIVKLLLEKGAPTDIPDSDGKTPLDYALECKHSDVLAMLFEDQVMSGSRLRTDCISDEVVFSYCQERKGMPDSQQRIRARELTMLECIKSDDEQQVKIAMFLLEGGTDPNCADEDGVPVMHLAVKHRQDDLLAALLERHAKASIVANRLLKESVLHLAARSGSVKAVKLLLSANADVNCLNSRQRTPLFDALERDNRQEMKKIILSLIDRGSDIDRADNEGRRVLHIAAEKGLVTPLRIFSFLAKDWNPVDKDGNRPLHYAMHNGHKQAIEFLQESALYYVMT
ncbi:hypothetical protein F5Y10DRAFT_273845 [Nemania abortiva]|nr:hypothetical protein F5Y10DRAFT_273845 [Nemania abortiva]